MTKPTTLFTAAGNGTQGPFQLTGLDALRHQNLTVYIWGTWGSATAKVQISPDGVNWFDFSSNSMTANGAISIPYTALAIQVVISGGTGNSLNAVAI